MAYLLFLILAAPFMAAQNAKPVANAVVKNRAPLQPNAFYRLPLTAIKPQGWLRQQLRVQADGLSGHLDEFWPDLTSTSGWLGGNGESWERGPYYADGLIPLAYLLDDAGLILKANKWVAWTLEHQRKDGGIGPEKNNDWWPNMIMLKALTQYQESTGDPRVMPLMERYFEYQTRLLSAQPLEKWANFRWQDEVLSVLWLYNRTGNRKLLDLARMLHQQGYDWKAQFANFEYKDKIEKSQLSLKTHVVNNAMALKTSGEWWLITGDKSDRDAVYRQFRELDRYHLLPNGVHSGDEHYAGKNPTQGTELCAVVEGMFSIEELMAILGDADFGDRQEKIAYNALPGTFTGDMWAHQYDQQANQVLVDVNPRQWVNNNADSNLFGLEPNFGCCTANYHQGWPKFTSSLWMATPDDGLAAVFYAPSEVTATVKNGVRVRILEETDYPFREKVRLTVSPESSAQFPLQLRIPVWAGGASISVNEKLVSGLKAGSFYRIDRTWNRGDRVQILFPMSIRASRWYRDSVAIERGPLVFSLKIGEDWRKVKDHDPAADWAVYPKTPWNYGLAVNLSHPEKSAKVIERPIGGFPFTPLGAPVEIEMQGRRIPAWQLENGSAGPLPLSPVASDQSLETLTLIPYGSAKLRITAFPVLK